MSVLFPFLREWSLPPSTSSYARNDFEEPKKPRIQRVTLWRRFRVGVTQMFRRVAIFFRRQKRRTSSGGSDRWESFDDEDSVDFLEIVSPLETAINSTPIRAPGLIRPPGSKPVIRRRTSLQLPLSLVSRRAAVF